MNRCCIIIVTYNGAKWLEKCLRITPPKTWEIVVVDNNSSDNTCSIIKKNYPYIKLFKNNNNLGFGSANNIGLKYAKENEFQHVLLLNQDAWITVEDIEKLITIQKKYPEYYILSPLHCNDTLQKLDNNFAKYISSIKELNEDAIIGNYKKEIYSAKYINAAIWLLNKQCLQKIGGFNPSFFHYAEDDNYLNRLFYHGGKLGLVPSIKGVHSRENRNNKVDFKTKLYSKYRSQILLPLSNPNVATKSSYLKIFMTLILKLTLYCLILNYSKVLLYNELIKLYIKNYKTIYENMLLSKNKEFAFLT